MGGKIILTLVLIALASQPFLVSAHPKPQDSSDNNIVPIPAQGEKDGSGVSNIISTLNLALQTLTARAQTLPAPFNQIVNVFISILQQVLNIVSSVFGSVGITQKSAIRSVSSGGPLKGFHRDAGEVTKLASKIMGLAENVIKKTGA